MSVEQSTMARETGAADSLVLRIAHGDAAAEREFFQRYEQGVRVQVRRHCRSGDVIAEDIAQDVMMRVLERLRGGVLRDEAALPAYIHAAIGFATVAEYRSRKRVESGSAEDHAGAAESPPERLEAEQLAARLRILLRELPVARDREILERFYFHEQGKAEICHSLGIEEAHFRRVVHRARERFRDLLLAAGVVDDSG